MTAHEPPTLREQLPEIRRWTLLVGVTVALTLLSGWALGGWNLPKMVSYVTGTFEVDDGTRERERSWSPTWVGSRGPQICTRCHMDRQVHLEDEKLTVLKEGRGPAWIVGLLPAHEHAWERHDCWSSVTRDGENVVVSHGLGPRLAPLGFTNELWLDHLQSLPEERAREILSTTAIDRAAFWGLAKELVAQARR